MSTLEKVRAVVAKKARCDEEEIDASTCLGDLRIDSLDWVQIIVTLEADFNIEIDMEMTKDFNNLGDLINYIERKRAS